VSARETPGAGPAPRRLERGRLVIATHNAGKLREMQDLLGPHGLEAVSAAALGLPVPDETGWMFAENAAIKARAAATATGLPALADDSGLCVEALDGAPGLFTADWAGPERDFGAAMARVKAELDRRGVATGPDCRCHFVSALVLAWPDGAEVLAEGRVFGHVAWPPRGPGGFGYDPLFQPDGHARTFGEMSALEKHGMPEAGGTALSHRARAFQTLRRLCLPEPL
jgi:XTP/dITP diphosphohydrolase